MGNALENALQLRETIKNAVGPVLAPTVGSFVAANPSSLPAALRPTQAALRRACDIYAVTGLLSAIGGADIFYGPNCNQYLGANAPVYNPGSEGLTGGQCPTNYNGSARVTVAGTPGGIVNFNNRPGPLRISATGNGSTSQGQGLFDASNSLIVGATDSSAPFDSIVVTVLTLVRADGQPDNCGNQSGNTPKSFPGRGGTLPPADFTYNQGDAPRTNISIGTLAVGINGQLQIPITIGDVDFDFGAELPGAEISPDTGLTDGVLGEMAFTDEETQLDAPLGTRIIGALVDVMETTTQDTTVFLENGMTLRVPRYGSLFFRRRGSNEGQFNIQLLNQVLWTASPEGADSILISPLPENVWGVTPILVPFEE